MGVSFFVQVLRNFRLGEATRHASWVPIFNARIKPKTVENVHRHASWVSAFKGRIGPKTVEIVQRPGMHHGCQFSTRASGKKPLKTSTGMHHGCQSSTCASCRKPSKSFITQTKVFVKHDVNSKLKSTNYVGSRGVTE